jgi:predicted RNA-binding protein with PUA-like domain
VNFWLFKTEPTTFGLDDLRAAPDATTIWDGVRNYQARNFLRDRVARGDRGVLYHSSCAVPAAVALLEVVRSGYPDPSAVSRTAPQGTAERPDARAIWYAVDVRLLHPFPRPVPRAAMRAHPALVGSRLLQRGNRLSVFPLTREEIRAILDLAGLDGDALLAPSS